MKKQSAVVRFTINFIANEITGTKASFDKASKGFGPVYEELAEKVAKHPNFKLVVKEQKKHTTKAKRTYNGMDFDFMKAYIETRVNAERIMSEYEAVKKMAEDSGISVYPFTKKWFLGEFDPDKQGFDMEKAKKEIADYRMAKAVLSATPASDEKNDDQTNDLALVD
ncbi:hypothetical protein JQM60_00445 [Butyricicoccus pullicaecorum]|nr:hypothetical protein [Butyricicoccus pullicaecorum]